MLSLVWFKRDLRVRDHPALALAASQGAVLPVHIVEPDYWAQPDVSGRQWAFMVETLRDLREDLAALGQPLILRVGDAVEVLARLRAKHRFAQIVSHEETGNGWTFARDRRVAEWARGAGVRWIEVPQSGVERRGPGREGWDARRARFLAQPLADVSALPPVAEGTGALPSARSLGLPEDPCPYRQPGGRRAGLQLLGSFLDGRGQHYRTALSSPLTAERACSRLSPHLAVGALSVREVAQGVHAQKRARRGQGAWPGSLARFEARLAGRDQLLQQLEDQPMLETRALHPALDDVPTQESEAALLNAWAAGETGLPFVDACMRYLRATGWLNFRLRALLQSVASHHLGLDWRITGQHLARCFTDYEPGIHWGQVQVYAGVAGLRTPRLEDPIRLGYAQDPDGAFIRRWLPELAAVPDAYLHEPWKWPQSRNLLGRRYPEPVVDPATALRTARARLSVRRRQAALHDALQGAAAPILGRGDNRKRRPPARHRASAQLSLDL